MNGLPAQPQSLIAREQARFDSIVAGQAVPITTLRELRRIKQRSVLERGSGHLPDQPHPVHPEPPGEAYLPGILTDLDRALSGITSPVQLTPWSRWFGSSGPVAGRHLPPTSGSVPRVIYQLRRSLRAGSTSEATMQWFRSLVPSGGLLSFEIVGSDKELLFQISVAESHAQRVITQLRTHSPEIEVVQAQDALLSFQSGTVLHWQLASHCLFPIALPQFSEPLNTLTGVLESLEEGEIAGIQLLIAPCSTNWIGVFGDAIGNGLEAAPGASELSGGLKEKTGLGPLFAVVLRTFASNGRIAEHLESYPALFASTRNRLLPGASVEIAELQDRTTSRYGILLATRELAAFAHLPGGSLQAPKLAYARKTRAAPKRAPQPGDLVIGLNHHQGIATPVVIPAELRTRHTHIVGVSGSGKSTLLSRMVLSDIEAGNGVCVIDPHGDLIDQEILPRIPDHRADDVIYLDPASAPIPLNLLYAHTEDEREHLTEDLVGIFKRASVGWGTQLESILAHAILVILHHPEGGHLGDLRDFLIDPAIRAKYLSEITDPQAASFFKSEFKLLPKQACAPVLTRLSSFLRRRSVRQLVCHRESSLDFREVMDSKKILLVRMGTGSLGEDNAHLLGSLIVAKLHQASLSRQNVRASDRHPFHLYMDEFQHFITPSLEAILSGGRKHGLALTLVHQETEQLWSRAREVAASVLANPATRICFSIGERDAATLAKTFAHFEAEDLVNLSRGEAIVRLERADCDFTMETLPPPELPEDGEVRAREIRELSALKYGCDLEVDEPAPYPGDPGASGEGVPPTSEPPPPAGAGTSNTGSDLGAPANPSPVPSESTPPESAAMESNANEEPQGIVWEAESAPPADSGDSGPTESPHADLAPAIDEAPPAELPISESRPEKRTTKKLPLPGKGGQQHKYLQHLIKKFGEDRGFRAIIERPVDGGSIDVALEAEALFIACEISITTTADHELDNVCKSLTAGATHILVIVPNAKSVRAYSQLFKERLDEAAAGRVSVVLATAVLEKIDEIAKNLEPEPTEVKGWKVKTSLETGAGRDRKSVV